MRIPRALRQFGLATLVMAAAVRELFGNHNAPPPVPEGRPAAPRSVLKIVFLTVVACFILLLLGGALLAGSGVYNIAADWPHVKPVSWMLVAGRTRSVEFHSRGIVAPDLHNPKLVSNGFVLYRKLCQPCHAAPGVPNEQIGRGINPKPPLLSDAQTHWTDPQLFWIVTHGLKMSGMPAFAPPLSDNDRWSIVAFVRQMALLSPDDYRKLEAMNDQGSEWAATNPGIDPGFELLDDAHPETGKALAQSYGCASCHEMPGIGRGLVGPPLSGFAERQYVAGSIVNTPANVVAFIMEPQKLKPHTAMPNLGVRRSDAIEMTAYLYTLGGPQRLLTLQRAYRGGGASPQARLNVGR